MPLPVHSADSGRQPLWALTAAALLGLPLLSGCRGMDLQPAWARSRLGMEGISINDVKGPEQRRLETTNRDRVHHDKAEYASTPLAAQFVELEAAQQLYDQKQFAQAERAFKSVRKHSRGPWYARNSKGIFRSRHKDLEEFQSPIEEDSQFMIAQSQFMQGHFANAVDSYELLLKDYPSTRHLDTVSRQLFRISREWLQVPDATDAELVRVAYGENANPTVEQRKNRGGGWFPNFTDDSRPAFDADGKALAALRLIWLHDAAGPLADDALMLAGNHYLAAGNHVEAAQHYRLLREQFPDSQHLKDALLLGSHVTLASYNGPGYDPSPLEEAKELKLLALQYPDLSEEDRTRLQGELDRIQEAEVEPLWKQVEFYMAKRQPESVVLQCNYIINKHPTSRFAKMAAGLKQQLESKGKSAPASWPYVAPQGAAPALQATAPSASGSPEESKSKFGRLLRRTEEPPKLQPVDESHPPARESPYMPQPAASPASGAGQAPSLFDDAPPQAPGRARVQW